MKSNTFIVFITLLILLLSCTNSYIDSRLVKAERLMESYPDSALSVLETISPQSLKRNSERALFSLLYTQALDKNHMSPTNDSIISFATNYYKTSDNTLNQILSNHYQGRVRYHNKNYPLAIVNFFKAKELAESNGNDFWAGMACRGISDIYMETYNRADELEFAQKEYEFIRKSGKQPYLNYALHDLGRALCNNGKTNESIGISEQLIDSAYKFRDAYLYNGALQLKAACLISEEKYEDAHPLISEICNGYFAETRDSLNLCLILAETGSYHEASKLLDSISDSNATFKRMVRYIIYKDNKLYEQALAEAQFVDMASDSILKSSLVHNLASSLTDYFEINKKLDEAEIHASNVKLWLIALCAFVACCILGGITMLFYVRHKRVISEKVLLAEQLQESLVQSKCENSNSEAIIKNLMSTKYELLEELGSIVLTNSDSKIARRKIADAVTKLIEDLSIRSEKITELENQINSIHNNLISDLKNDLPYLKEADYRLYLFSVLRLSNATISLFLKEDKVEAVYNRRRRLKEKIKNLEDTKRDRYLKYLC